MKKYNWISFLLLVLFISCDDNKTSPPPNIIIIFTDDMGYADVGCNGIREDNKTPNIDKIAQNGIRVTAGYSTAPQCVPSRAGILTGIYQNRFGVSENNDAPLPQNVPTIATRISKFGYNTGYVGKWNLELHKNSTKWLADNNFESIESVDSTTYFSYFPWNRGFNQVFCGYGQTVYVNYDLKGKVFNEVKKRSFKKYRVDLQSEAALSFIKQNKNKPFFLFLSYFAPHTPLEAPEKYLSRFTDDMPNRRRLALSMNAAIDDGVGKIIQNLKKYRILDNTIIFFVSDNGAPLVVKKEDAPISNKLNLWNGSLNDPWVGEKGMLTEGGIRVPFLLSWEGVLSKNVEYSKPITCLDISATAVALAGGSVNELDGVNLIPFLTELKDQTPHKEIFWKWSGQEAVRNFRYKYLRFADGPEYLFDLESPAHETENLITQFPDIAKELKQKLYDWRKNLLKPDEETSIKQYEKAFRKHYLKNVTTY